MKQFFIVFVWALTGVIGAYAQQTITLSASNADLSQAYGARRENNPANIGYWPKQGIVQWNISQQRVAPGNYSVSLNYSRQANDSVRISVATSSDIIEADLPATGNWTNYQSRTIGTIQIASYDTTLHIALSHSDRSGSSSQYIMNLRDLTLSPQVHYPSSPQPLPQPSPQQPINSFALTAQQANLSYASGARLENNPQNIGNWTRRGIVTWTVPSNVVAGSYTVTANYSRATPSSQAVRITVYTSSAVFDADIPGTVNWTSYTSRNIGSLWLNPNDQLTIALSNNDRSSYEYIMNLRSLNLTLTQQQQPLPAQPQPSRPTIPSPSQPQPSRPAIPPPPPPRR
ncbi:MAG: hypothetical protein LBQ77_03930 [Treponema sp.]|nr:hypothetical protein [Treponema sp.]